MARRFLAVTVTLEVEADTKLDAWSVVADRLAGQGFLVDSITVTELTPPDPEALIRSIAASIAGGVVWEYREDFWDVKDGYRALMAEMDAGDMLEAASYVLNPEGDVVNADHS